ncbi:MFS transporter [Streptacidiphilus neutrinimicus]|uniref:MFS transporter n=1 Tax=Streptacidiphilus neutrinimicus TaxID=105420 RepID=UPI0006932090|nr:MFS transporter [Streptacidiphilus neutrinimicus]
MRTLLAQPRMRLYFLGNTLSTIGDYALWLASGVWVKELTGSTAQAGLCMLSLILGTLLSPVTGYLVDRTRRKPLLMATNAVTGLAVLALTQVHGPADVWLIYAVMFVNGLAVSLTDSAMTALLPAMVEPEQLGAANGLSQALTQGQRLITPALGIGLLTAFGGGAVAAIDAASFAAGLLCWAFVRVDDPRPESDRVSRLAQTTAGFRFLLRTPSLRQLSTTLFVGLFVAGMFETLGFAVVTVGLHRAPTWMGVLVTAMGVSGILGGLLVGALIKPLGPGRLTALGLALCGAGALAFAAPLTAVVLVGSLCMGFALPCIIVGSMTAIQLSTPKDLLGRVSGADIFLTTCGQALGMATGSALITAVFYRDIAYAAAALLAVSALYLVTRREQREAPPTTEEQGAAEPATEPVATEPATEPVTPGAPLPAESRG